MYSTVYPTKNLLLYRLGYSNGFSCSNSSHCRIDETPGNDGDLRDTNTNTPRSRTCANLVVDATR